VKLCIVTPCVIKGDGQGRANYEIAWEAIRRGHNVTLVARKVAPDLQENSLVNWIYFSAENMPTELVREMIFSRASASWLRQHRHEFDLVQVYGAITSAAGDVNTAQFVHTSWLRSPVHTSRVNHNIYGAYHWIYTKLNSYWEKKAFRQARVAIAVSEKIKDELVDNVGIESDRIRVILNGVDVQEFVPGCADRKKLGLPVGVTLALFAGDIRINRKNLDTVLHALVQVPDLHLAVVGDTTKSPYPQLAASLNLSDRVHFLGFRRDIAQVMQAVDLFVFPSRYEPFGLVVIEAMATGIPVITASSTGAAEVVTKEAGIVLPDSDDIEALAQALKFLAGDRDLRNQMGLAARTIAEQHSWVSKAQKYVDLFEEIVNDDHHRSHTDLSPSSRPEALPGSAQKANSASI
jgi:glycosyltransferase involved in cell wall biosynthesis